MAALSALKKLSGNTDVVILCLDKGNSTIIVNKIDYINNLQESELLLSDSCKFKKLYADVFHLCIMHES